MKGIETLLVSMMFYGTDEVVSTTAARAALWIQMFEAKRCSWLKAFYEPLKLFWEGSDGDLDAPVLRLPAFVNPVCDLLSRVFDAFCSS